MNREAISPSTPSSIGAAYEKPGAKLKIEKNSAIDAIPASPYISYSYTRKTPNSTCTAQCKHPRKKRASQSLPFYIFLYSNINAI
jgi:hypothetical protein